MCVLCYVGYMGVAMIEENRTGAVVVQSKPKKKKNS